mmetsp:Transcript_5146/g.13936  ORF Transcript_5146/g.13936 Transcript_5146/m.13936 type:complete len:296 (+) Transcript_5146:308-1195(+)
MLLPVAAVGEVLRRRSLPSLQSLQSETGSAACAGVGPRRRRRHVAVALRLRAHHLLSRGAGGLADRDLVQEQPHNVGVGFGVEGVLRVGQGHHHGGAEGETVLRVALDFVVHELLPTRLPVASQGPLDVLLQPGKEAHEKLRVHRLHETAALRGGTAEQRPGRARAEDLEVVGEGVEPHPGLILAALMLRGDLVGAALLLGAVGALPHGLAPLRRRVPALLHLADAYVVALTEADVRGARAVEAGLDRVGHAALDVRMHEIHRGAVLPLAAVLAGLLEVEAVGVENQELLEELAL